MDLAKVSSVYVIGIKGSGIIAVVELLAGMGINITGSDTEEKFFSDDILKRLGIEYYESFSEEHIPADVDLIFYSTAYNVENNVEMRAAKESDIPMMSYPQILAQLFNSRYGIAVCGTHGKTTTSALLASALKSAGVDPTAVIGSKVIDWQGNALSGQGEFFVAETDEYQNKLQFYEPKAAVLTSCDYDHPDYFKTFEDYRDAFRNFVAKIPKIGFLVLWGDSTDTLEIAKSATCEVLRYGIGEDCEYRIANYALEPGNEGTFGFVQKFDVFNREENLGTFRLSINGKHNVLNATAVIAVCHRMKLNLLRVEQTLLNFKGTARRFEYIGEKNGAILIDDYGHHPEEIKATLRSARVIYPDKNIWAVFHPHTYTRTKALLSEFSQSFSDADKVVILDVYGSARETQGGVHAQDLVDLINKYDRGKAEYVPTIDEVVAFLENDLSGEDVVITIGAGNVWEVAEKLKEAGQAT